MRGFLGIKWGIPGKFGIWSLWSCSRWDSGMEFQPGSGYSMDFLGSLEDFFPFQDSLGWLRLDFRDKSRSPSQVIPRIPHPWDCGNIPGIGIFGIFGIFFSHSAPFPDFPSPKIQTTFPRIPWEFWEPSGKSLNSHSSQAPWKQGLRFPRNSRSGELGKGGNWAGTDPGIPGMIPKSANSLENSGHSLLWEEIRGFPMYLRIGFRLLSDSRESFSFLELLLCWEKKTTWNRRDPGIPEALGLGWGIPRVRGQKSPGLGEKITKFRGKSRNLGKTCWDSGQKPRDLGKNPRI